MTQLRSLIAYCIEQRTGRVTTHDRDDDVEDGLCLLIDDIEDGLLIDDAHFVDPFNG